MKAGCDEIKTDESSDWFTFKVHDVKHSGKKVRSKRMHELLKSALGSEIVSCSDYHTEMSGGFQGFLASVYQAFSQHHPLVISPDIVWLTITQGIAHHMALHGEGLRERFVGHQGKVDLVFTCEDWVLESPENPWEEAFQSWTSQIRDHVGAELHDHLTCDFSTTGKVELAASQVTMLDIFQQYFRYVAYCICGIPEITLRGSTHDWERLSEKVKALRVFDMDWWLDSLQPLCDEFVSARKGNPDVEHWKNICKLESAYGGDIINGWIAKFFPYIRSFIGGPCHLRNPIFESGNGFMTLNAPNGIAKAPFVFFDGRKKVQHSMEALGGTIGFTVDPETMAIEAKAFWAVRKATSRSTLLQKIIEDHHVEPAPSVRINFSNGQAAEEHRVLRSLPNDMHEFYFKNTRASMFRQEDSSYRLQLFDLDKFSGIDFGEQPEEFDNSKGPEPECVTWYRFASLGSDSILACDLDLNRSRFEPRDWSENRQDRIFCPICVVQKNRPDAKETPVVALSFTELIEKLIESDGKPYWQVNGFEPYEFAHFYIRD